MAFWHRFFRIRRRRDDLQDEIDAHLAIEIQQRMDRGELPHDARRNALRDFGNVPLVTEVTRDIWGWTWLEQLLQDLRHTFRSFLKNPVLTLTIILTLTIAIGGTTSMFTIIRAVLLKPLAYRDPERIVQISGGSTIVQYQEFKSAARSYEEIGAALTATGNVTLYGKDGPEVLRLGRVSANFLRILGVQPMLGRGLQAEDEDPASSPVMLISAELWDRRFGRDPAMIGKTVTLDTGPHTIVGVLPAGFSFPYERLDAWATPPMGTANLPPAGLNSPVLILFGRLAPSVSIEQANAELTLLHKQYALAHPGMLDAKASPHTVTPLRQQVVTNVSAMLWMLFGAVGLVLMIACANVAGLMLAQATSRSREFALRATLGAGRRRLIQHVVVGSLAVACVGGTIGVLLARWSVSAITGMTSFRLPRSGEIRLDLMVIVFAAAISIVAGLIFGLVPALAASRSDLFGLLRTNDASGATLRRKRFWRSMDSRAFLMIGQVALSIVLLIGATLLMQSMARVYSVDPGFNPRNLLTMQIVLSPSRYGTDRQKAAFFDELFQRLHLVPGIENAAVSNSNPMANLVGRPVQVAGRPPIALNERPIAVQQNITPEYFRTVQIPVRRGREFSDRDGRETPPVVIVNETLARRFWPEYPLGENPVGRQLLLGIEPQPREIVGIVADAHRALDKEASPEIYLLYAQSPFPISALTIRTRGNPASFAGIVRDVVLAIDPNQPITAVRAMEEVMEETLGQRRLVMTLLQIFAAVALTLALVGIYGTIAYSVGQRTREVGIRMALGAQRRYILRLLLQRGFGITSAGVLLGLAGAFFLTRFLKTFLFQISAADPMTFLVIAVVFAAVALIASYIPVRRVVRIDPMIVLRHD